MNVAWHAERALQLYLPGPVEATSQLVDSIRSDVEAEGRVGLRESGDQRHIDALRIARRIAEAMEHRRTDCRAGLQPASRRQGAAPRHAETDVVPRLAGYECLL